MKTKLIKRTPLGIMKYEDLISRATSLIKLRPDFAPAFDALIEAESRELYEYWLEIRYDCSPAMIILNDKLTEG